MRIKYCLFIFLAFLTSCSTFSNKTPEPELRNLLVELTNKYLTNVAQGKLDKTTSMIYWEEFLGHGNEQISKEEFLKQFQSIAKTWKPQEIPFLGLNIKEITADDSDAEVILEKKIPRL